MKKRTFVFVGSDPLDQQQTMNESEIENQTLIIKYQMNSNSLEREGQEQCGPKRQRDRTIQEILEKVQLWRKMYEGFYDESD